MGRETKFFFWLLKVSLATGAPLRGARRRMCGQWGGAIDKAEGSGSEWQRSG